MAHQFKPRLSKPYLKVEASHYYEYEKWIIVRFSLDLSTSHKYGSVMNDPYYYEYEKWIIVRFSLDLSTSHKYGSVMNDP